MWKSFIIIQWMFSLIMRFHLNYEFSSQFAHFISWNITLMITFHLNCEMSAWMWISILIIIYMVILVIHFLLNDEYSSCGLIFFFTMNFHLNFELSSLSFHIWSSLSWAELGPAQPQLVSLFSPFKAGNSFNIWLYPCVRACIPCSS